MQKYYVDTNENSDTRDWVFLGKVDGEHDDSIEVWVETNCEEYTFQKGELTEISKEEYNRLLDIILE